MYKLLMVFALLCMPVVGLAGMQENLDSWIGKRPSQLIEQMGLPTEQMTIGTVEYYQYTQCRQGNSMNLGRGIIVPTSRGRCAKLIFEVENGKIVRASFNP